MSDEIKLIVTVAHDYICPWCWAGLFHANRLKEEFPDLQLNWIGYELLPEELGPLPDYPAKPWDPETRFVKFANTENIPLPERKIGLVRSHAALEGAEYFKDKAPDKFDLYNSGVYRAYWELGEDISDVSVLKAIAVQGGADGEDFADAVSKKVYKEKIVRFDEDAYAKDVTHVPTFIFRGERCAEAPYATIRDLAQRNIIWYGPKD
jgi:predicted DsbA family dithiol-disulfide isomerase